jgi:glycosyltransferase involved in cell wall biosynthesis
VSAAAGPPLVSVVVPCRNERPHIADCLASVLEGDYPADRLEVLVADGMSDDGTRDVLADWAARDARVHWFDNPARTTPAALNAAIRRSHGDVVVLMGAHCRYPPHYVSRLVAWLERSEADVVGGVCRTLPSGKGPLARAIALALAHPFGVGNSYFRIGTGQPRWVDTVPFGCYRRGVFERIGLFDEELVRNQDDEFNYRLLGHGGRLLLVPEVVSEYFARDSMAKLARMFYQYGRFKPVVIRKLGRVVTGRQLVPPLFVLGLLATPLLALVSTRAAVPALALGLVYATAASLAALRAAWRDGAACTLLLALTFPVMHVAYGTGFLRGAAAVLFRRGGVAEPGAVTLTR